MLSDAKASGKCEIMPEEKCPKCGRKKFVIDYDRGEIRCTDCGHLIVENASPSDMPGWTALVAKQGKAPGRFSPAKAQNKDDRMIANTLSEIERVVPYLNLPEEVRESAVSLYLRCVDKDIIKNISRGRHTESIIAALIYYVCKEQKIRMTFDKIIKAADADKEEAEEVYASIAREI